MRVMGKFSKKVRILIAVVTLIVGLTDLNCISVQAGSVEGTGQELNEAKKTKTINIYDEYGFSDLGKVSGSREPIEVPVDAKYEDFKDKIMPDPDKELECIMINDTYYDEMEKTYPIFNEPNDISVEYHYRPNTPPPAVSNIYVEHEYFGNDLNPIDESEIDPSFRPESKLSVPPYQDYEIEVKDIPGFEVIKITKNNEKVNLSEVKDGKLIVKLGYNTSIWIKITYRKIKNQEEKVKLTIKHDYITSGSSVEVKSDIVSGSSVECRPEQVTGWKLERVSVDGEYISLTDGKYIVKADKDKEVVFKYNRISIAAPTEGGVQEPVVPYNPEADKISPIEPKVINTIDDRIPQGTANTVKTPANETIDETGIADIDEDDTPQGKAAVKEDKIPEIETDDTVEITVRENDTPKGEATLPKTGGTDVKVFGVIGLGLIGLGFVVKKRK